MRQGILLLIFSLVTIAACRDIDAEADTDTTVSTKETDSSDTPASDTQSDTDEVETEENDRTTAQESDEPKATEPIDTVEDTESSIPIQPDKDTEKQDIFDDTETAEPTPTEPVDPIPTEPDETPTEPVNPNTTKDDPTDANCHDGNYRITTEADLYSIQETTCILGDLDINEPEIDSLSLPNLIRVEGLIRLSNPNKPLTAAFDALESVDSIQGGGNQLLTLSMPKLTHANDVAFNGNMDINIDLSSLETVENNISINGNMGAVALKFDDLSFVGGQLVITTCKNLSTLTLGSLEQIGAEFILDGLTNLDTLDVSTLQQAPYIKISATEHLNTIAIQMLTTSKKVGIERNTALETLDLSGLEAVTEDLIVIDNTVLNSMVLPHLQSVEANLAISRNPMLACDAEVLFSAAPTAVVSICQNGENEMCGADSCSK